MIEHHRICDVNEVRCTHNKDTDIDIWVREQQSIIYMMAQINCESQLQANEVAHQIKRFISPGKYIQLFPFSSFQQIPSYFFNTEYNDPNKHEIENLYMKYEPETGNVSYYFQMNYKPLFRFNSVTAEISDNSARSYPVMCDISYLIQLPMWLFDTFNEPNILRINLGLNISDSINSIVADNNFLSVSNKSFTINDIEYKIIQRYIIDPTTPNYHDKRIKIPAPSDSEFMVQIAKLYPKKSTVVSWIGSHKSLSKEITKENLRYWLGFKDIETRILDENDYTIIKSDKIGKDEIIIFSNDKEYLTPDLDSPIIITIHRPILEEEKVKEKKMMNAFSNPVYEIREPKNWKKLK